MKSVVEKNFTETWAKCSSVTNVSNCVRLLYSLLLAKFKKGFLSNYGNKNNTKVLHFTFKLHSIVTLPVNIVKIGFTCKHTVSFAFESFWLPPMCSNFF